MDYKKFIDEYNVANDKTKYVQKHMLNSYVPYEDKVAECRTVVDITSHKMVNVNGQEHKIYWNNTPMQHMFYILTLISLYTDIEWEKDSGNSNENLKVYNELSKNGSIYIIISLITPFEKQSFDTVLNMVEEDMYENERSIPSYLDTKIDAFSLSINEIMKNLPTELINK